MNERALTMLNGLMNIPKGTEVLLTSTPFAWVFCIVFGPRHCYYVVVDKDTGAKDEG